MALYKAPRGTLDILPEDQPYWRHIYQTIHHLCSLYGYEQIDTPMFEETHLFARGIGEATELVEKQMYTFEDRGGTSLTLRPEFTAGVVRAYLEHGMYVRPQPAKVYSLGPTFRHERPQAGRYRQFTQWNVEAIGEMDPAVDLEVMVICWALYEEMGFSGLSFELNSTGCPRCRPAYLRFLEAYYRDHIDEICDDCRRRLELNPLRVLDCKADVCQPIIAEAPQILGYLCDECADHFATLRQYLDALDRPYRLNHRLVRGLDYYTKTVFEVWAAGIGAQNALCGGGRYDGLAEELGGPPTPAVGFAAGLERIVLTMKEQDVEAPPLPAPAVFVATLGQEAKTAGLRLLAELREAGLGAVSTFGDRSLRAQLRQANRQKVSYAVILGEQEVESGQATVRSMADRQQWEVSLAELVECLKARLEDTNLRTAEVCGPHR